ncbi:MAG: hypothetical protein IKQ15_04890 [Kiritimatiellae bacterium]|nr:hypothetical protein [Kiritimatiellia bacterium]
MEMERFWRWSLVALVSFGVMLVSAGILGTLKLSSGEEEKTVEDNENQWPTTDGADHSARDEIGWGERHDHSEHGSATGDEAKSQEASAVPVKVSDPGKVDSAGPMTGEQSVRHERQGTSSPDATSNPPSASSGGEAPKRVRQQEQANGPTNRPVATPVQQTAGATSVAVPAQGGNPSPAGKSVASTSMHAVTNDRTLHQSNQSGVGWGKKEGAKADDADEEDEE